MLLREWKTYIFLHREKELNFNESKWLKSFKNVNIFSIRNLHSKIYINDKIALISSMNLYEYSQINNHEIGVKLDYLNDNENYKDTLNEVRIILESEHSNHNFQDIIDSTEDYSMRRLFFNLNKKYSFKNYSSGSQYLYEFISNKAREIVDFEKDELYQDGTAILRATELGKARYQKLEKELKKLSN